ncbi:MAG: hypothetical protein AB1630_02020 [bacterium]
MIQKTEEREEGKQGAKSKIDSFYSLVLHSIKTRRVKKVNGYKKLIFVKRR